MPLLSSNYAGVSSSLHLRKKMSAADVGSVSAAWFLTAAVTAMVVIVMYLYAPCWKVRKIPGPPLAPAIGHLHLLAKHGPDVFSLLARKYGPIYRFHLGRQPLVIVADPELCKEVGIKKFKSIMNRSLPSPISGSPLHQKGLFFSRDSRWSAMRNTIISLYQPCHLSNLIPTMQISIEKAFHNLETKPNKDINFSDISLKLATDIIARAAFGVDLGLSTSASDQVSSFVDLHVSSTASLKMDLSGSLSTILGTLAPILQKPLLQILKRIPGTVDRKVDRVNAELTRRMNLIVNQRAREEDSTRNDFLSKILKARKTGGDLFTADYVSTLTYEHLLAGSTTTSFTLSSILYLVAGHPRVEQKLIEEVDASSPSDSVPTAEDLRSKYPYLDQVIKEAMRFYTVSPLVAREASERVEVGGYYLPKGTWIWLALGVLAKDPEQFPEPEEFRPERFDPDVEEETRRHPYANIPFGIGPRSCIGRRFSLQEIKLAVIYLYRRYVFRRSPYMESPLALEYGIVLGFKYGVKLQVFRR